MTEQERIRNRILKSGKFPTSPTAASPAAAGAFTPTEIFENVPKTPATSYASALANATVPKTTPKYNTSYAQTFAEMSSPKISTTPPTSSYKDVKLPQSDMTYGELEEFRIKADETVKKIAEENAKAKVENDPFWRNYSTVPKPVGEGDSADMIFTPKDSSAKDVAMVSLSGTKNNGALYMPEGWEDIKEISPQRMIAVVPKIGNKVTEQFYSVKQPIETELNELYADLDELDARIYPHRHTLSISTTEEDKAAVREVLAPLEAKKTELEKKIAEKEARFQEVKSLERLLIYNEYQNVLKNDPESKRKIIDGQRLDDGNILKAYLTPDERQIYYYIVAEYGKVEARKFIGYFEDELRFRKAQFEYEYINDDPDGWLKKAALVYGGSFVDAVTGAWGGIKQFFSDKPVEKPYIVDTANYIKAQETGAAGVAYDVLGTLGYMTPAMLTATLTGTGVAGNLFTYLSASGNAYSEKIKQGYSPAEAKIYSNLVGAAEAGLQYALGGISKLGKGANTGLIAQKIGSIENAFVRASTDLAYRGLKEITEEELQLFLEPFISSMVFDEKYDAPTMEEMLYTALISFGTTGIFEIPEIAGDYSAVHNDNKADKELGSWLRSDNADADGEITRSVINEGLDSAPDTESYTYAERMRGRTDAGKKVSDRQLGHMYRANVEAVNTENSLGEGVLKNPGYMIDTSPAQLLKGEEMGNASESVQRRNVLSSDSLNPKTDLEKSVVKSAIDIGMNNTDATRSLVELTAKLSNESGMPIRFTTTSALAQMGYSAPKRVVNGVYTPREILINAESPNAGQTVLGHEFTHWIQKSGLFNDYSKYITDYAKSIGAYDTAKNTTANDYSGMVNPDVNVETVANLTGEYLFTDEAFVSKLAEHRNLFQRIYDKIRHYYNLATAGSPEARLLERAKYIFEKAYRSQRGKNNSSMTDYVQYAINYKNYTNLDFENNAKYLLKMSPVKELTGNEFSDKSIPLKNRIKNFFDSIGNNVETTEFGDVALNNSSLHDDFGHGTTYNKVVSYAAIPEVLKNGVVIDSQLRGGNHYERIVVAAPVTISGELYYMGVMIQRDFQSQRLYLHDVIIANAKETISSAFETSPSTTGVTNENDSLHMTSILKKALLVNSDFSLTPKKSQQAEDEVLDFEDYSDAEASPTSEPDNRSLDELLGLDTPEESAVKEIKLPTAEDILSGNYTPATPVTTPVKEIKLKTGEEIVAEERAKEEALLDKDKTEIEFDESQDLFSAENSSNPLQRKYDFTVGPVSERFSRMLEARQNTLDELISNRYYTEESFNDEISYLEMQYRDMKNPETTKKGIALSKRITKLKEQRDTRLAEMDAQIEKARKRVDALDEKEYSRMAQRRAKEQERQNLISKTVGSTVNWKDKPGGAFWYDLNTLRRNLRDIVRDANGKPDIELADRIYDMLQGGYSRHEAQMKQEILSIADKFAALEINNAESTYIQMLGELRSNPDTTLTQEEVEEFYRDHKKKIDTDKVEKAIAMARETYDSLFNRLNEVLREQGMKEIPYRQGYFPHYTKEKNGFFAKLLNWKSKNNSLPTDIAGLTEEFNPKKSYQPFDKRREGDTTEYNFLEGLDNYVRGALDWIYHIEDIALRRSFEDYIRYEHSEKAMRDKIDDIRSEGLDPEEERVLIDEALKDREHQLGNFLASFRAQTNVLAGKKHGGDRTVEQKFGRGTYSFAQNVSSRINGNMVAANVASALTNFIPLTQSWAEVSPKQTLIAMKDTLRSFRHDDGIREKSVFLTNRLTEDKRLYQTGWDKVSDKAAALMGAIDSFTSETIWRSKYAQNLEKGMSEDEAIANADEYCEGLIASRSRGEMPGEFDKKNVFAKVLTSFQLEVNNQYGYLFKDLPKNKETKLGVVWGLVKMFLGAYGFNWLYEKITGRRPALDPIGMVAAFIDDIAEDDEDKWMNLGESLLEQVPFVGSLFGGGRIPLQSAIPDVSNTWNAIKSEDWGTLGWELAKPAAYLALPTGGGQLYKTAKGIDAITKGGSYKTDSKGNEILQYPYYSDEGANSIFQGTKAVLFGKNSLPTAGDWVDSGFKSLNTDQTKAYEGMISAGDGQRESFEFIEKIRGLETHKEKRQALNDSVFSDEAKYSVYYNMLADKNENDPEKDERYSVLDNLEDHSAINTILAVETSEDNHGKIQAVANAQLTSNDRALIIKEYISEDAYKEATDLTRKGLTYDEYFDAYFIWDKIKADNKDSKVRRTEFAHWLNKNGKNMNATERAALREALIGEGETSYDKLVGAGVSDKGAYEVGLKLDKLDPDPYSTYKTVQPYQKYRVIVNSSLSDRDTVAAMKAISTDAQAQKIQKLADSGIDLNLFARLAENIGKAGKSVWSVSNSELHVWIDRLTPPALGLDAPLTWPKIKSTMYSILTENKNNSSVPSSTHIKMVLDKHYGRTK